MNVTQQKCQRLERISWKGLKHIWLYLLRALLCTVTPKSTSQSNRCILTYAKQITKINRTKKGKYIANQTKLRCSHTKHKRKHRPILMTQLECTSAHHQKRQDKETYRDNGDHHNVEVQPIRAPAAVHVVQGQNLFAGGDGALAL